jgi:hypothetical protein
MERDYHFRSSNEALTEDLPFPPMLPRMPRANRPPKRRAVRDDDEIETVTTQPVRPSTMN